MMTKVMVIKIKGQYAVATCWVSLLPKSRYNASVSNSIRKIGSYKYKSGQ